jgi:hypothetical protein
MFLLLWQICYSFTCAENALAAVVLHWATAYLDHRVRAETSKVSSKSFAKARPDSVNRSGCAPSWATCATKRRLGLQNMVATNIVRSPPVLLPRLLLPLKLSWLAAKSVVQERIRHQKVLARIGIGLCGQYHALFWFNCATRRALRSEFRGPAHEMCVIRLTKSPSP